MSDRVTVIAGSRALPAGFMHPHASDEARRVAEDGLILRVPVGSGVHGTSISGRDDRDEMGICLEPAQFVTGVARVPNGVNGQGPSMPFEQYERHTAWDRPGGVANRSGAGDLDVVVYSARKWARLALAGVELLSTGQITLPVPQPERDYLRAVRRGEVPLVDVLEAIDTAEHRLLALHDSECVPIHPDVDWANDWLHRAHMNYWATNP